MTLQRSLHPLHAIFLAGTVPLFLGVLLNDIAYSMTYEIQWKNFASWLIVGGLILGGLVLAWAIAESVRMRAHTATTALYPILLVAMWGLGFINALVHASDAWASMPTGPVLSAIVALLAMLATGLGFYRPYSRAAQ